MYYRVAIRRQGDLLDQPPSWQWKSTALSSLDALFQFLRLFRALPQDRLRVFSSSSREDMNEQLARENMGYGSTSVTAAQFLRERRLSLPEIEREVPEHGTRGSQEAAFSVAAIPSSMNGSSAGANTLYERGTSSLDRRRGELEGGAGGDHDLPYSFALPPSLPQVLAWMRLLAKVKRGELQP